MSALNLTQHAATPDQRAAGVVDLPEQQRAQVQALLTFDACPSRYEISRRAAQIADVAALVLADDLDGWPARAMIGGAPFLMAPLERALFSAGIMPCYAFSKRESVETVEGSEVKKSTVFRHAGLVAAVDAAL